ncbi:MAG: Na/Pi cotransporter family protein [Acholeplasmatales bacterium]|nr:Na/Pi cotransporter family protein [Acholeplasmatales bacterium]
MMNFLLLLSSAEKPDYVAAVIGLLAGLGALLIGFKLLSDNIEKLATTGLKKLFNKTSKNRWVGIGIGAAVTAIIQSSGASTIMIVGFVNAGLMSLFQATAMIMGANIGTTVTAQIASLGSFDVALYATLLAFIGAFMNMLCKKEKPKTIGLALAGLGLVFVSLDAMKTSMSVFSDSKAFTDLLQNVSNPFLLLFIGIGLTALLQSSSALTTILIAMATAGLSIGKTPNDIIYVILGTNIGSCVTALLSSFGASINGKRASLIHLMFNTFGSVIFFIVLFIWPTFMENTFMTWFPNAPGTQIAMFHTLFNVLFTLFFCPFINVFVIIAKKLIPDKKEKIQESLIDERFLSTPTVALSQATKEVARMGRLSMEALNLGIDAFIAHDMDKSPEIHDKVMMITKVNENIVSYLVKISSNTSTNKDEEFLAILHSSVSDLYRSAEVADNMTKYTRHLVQDQLVFSQIVFEQLKEFKLKLNEQYENVELILLDKQYDMIKRIDELEDEMDALRSKLFKDHVSRLEKGECSLASSSVFINLVSNLERAGDHLHSLAHSLTDNIQ